MATKVLAYDVIVDNSKVKAESFFPGISYDDFDRGECIHPWKISRMLEAGRMVPFYLANFVDINTLKNKDFGFYMLGGDYYFDSCLWELPSRSYYFPFKVSIQLLHHGTASLTFRQILVNILDGRELAHLYCKVVYVNRKQRKSQNLPDWHREKYKHVESHEGIRLDKTLTCVPSGAYQVQRDVVGSDTDHNGHTNQASYIKFCMDAVESARLNHKFERFTKEICLYPIKKMSTAYQAETHIGDQLVINVWEDQLFPFVVHFIIHKKDKIAYSSTVVFKYTSCSKL